MTLELRCSRDLAIRLGAIGPDTVQHHRQLRDAGHMLVRDGRTGWALFWPWELSECQKRMALVAEDSVRRSS